MTRPAVAILSSVLFVIGVSAVQWFVTTPGQTTYGELRVLTVASIPALVTILSASWVNAGRRDRD